MKRISLLFAAVFFAAPLAGAADAPTNVLSDCQAELDRFQCPVSEDGLGSDVVDCLQPHWTVVNPNCRTAMLRVSPVLGLDLELRTACAGETQTLCPSGLTGLDLGGCLESRYHQAGTGCVAKLMELNSAFRARVEKERKDEAIAAQPVSRVLESEHAAVREAQKGKRAADQATEARRDRRWKECAEGMKHEYSDPHHPAISGFCTSYSELPEPDATQAACMTVLTTSLTKRYRKKFSDHIAAETASWGFCGRAGADSAFLECAKEKLQAGEDIYYSGNACNPEYIKCAKYMTEREPPVRNRDRFLYDVCVSFGTFYETPEGGEVMSCVRELYRRFPNTGERDKDLVRICGQKPVYRHCVLGRLTGRHSAAVKLGFPYGSRELKAIDTACLLEPEIAAGPPKMPEPPSGRNVCP